MKKTNKKGFTIVELVIVIAVIAILAAVLIPTFSNVIANANESAALSTASNVYKEALIEQEDANLDDDTKIYVKQAGKTYIYTVSDGKLTADSSNTSDTVPTTTTSGALKAFGGGTIVISESDYNQLSDKTGWTAASNSEEG